MRILNHHESNKVTGAYACSYMIGGLPFFNVTDDSYYSIEEGTFGYPNQLLQDIVFFSNRVETLSGQNIFRGNSGSFCYKGNNFSVMSINENSISIGNTYFLTRVY